MKRFLNKGMTLVELVVVIIILILLAVIAIWNTDKPLQEAEAAVIMTEFKAVYESVSTVKDNYNMGYDLVQGKDYCTVWNGLGYDWYVIYGIQDSSSLNDNVLTNLGLQDLKRSYMFRINEDDPNSSDIEVRYFGNRYVSIAGYKIYSYEDLQSVKGEITK